MGLGILISLVCLWLALRSVPFADLGQALSQANYFWLIPCLILTLILNLIRAEIWRLLLGKRISRSDAFWAYSTGFLFNNIFPFRIGEAARVVVLAVHRRLPVVEVAATAGLERLLDVIALVLLLLGILPFMTVSVQIKQGAMVFGGLAVFALIIIFGLAKAGRYGEILLYRLLRPVAPHYKELVIARWHELVKGLTVLTQPSIGIPAFIGAILVWTCTVAMQWCVLRAFQPLASPIEAAFMVAAISLAIAMPAAPGFVGVYQWVGQQSLLIPFPNHYTASSALGIAIVAHLTSYLFSTLLGMIGLWYFGQSFNGLGQLLNKSAQSGEALSEI